MTSRQDEFAAQLKIRPISGAEAMCLVITTEKCPRERVAEAHLLVGSVVEDMAKCGDKVYFSFHHPAIYVLIPKTREPDGITP